MWLTIASICTLFTNAMHHHSHLWMVTYFIFLCLWSSCCAETNLLCTLVWRVWIHLLCWKHFFNAVYSLCCWHMQSCLGNLTFLINLFFPIIKCFIQDAWWWRNWCSSLLHCNLCKLVSLSLFTMCLCVWMPFYSVYKYN